MAVRMRTYQHRSGQPAREYQLGAERFVLSRASREQWCVEGNRGKDGNIFWDPGAHAAAITVLARVADKPAAAAQFPGNWDEPIMAVHLVHAARVVIREASRPDGFLFSAPAAVVSAIVDDCEALLDLDSWWQLPDRWDVTAPVDHGTLAHQLHRPR